uniref:Uncharacterized protein n=1 Tax=viral metagenome TaxID=1070528 RepID=A0A6C0LFV5_9ZZZZ
MDYLTFFYYIYIYNFNFFQLEEYFIIPPLELLSHVTFDIYQ